MELGPIVNATALVYIKRTFKLWPAAEVNVFRFVRISFLD